MLIPIVTILSLQLQGRTPRSLETICKKIKKRRDLKKRLICEKNLTSKIHKQITEASSTSNINQDDVVQTIPPDTNVSSDITAEKCIQNESPRLPIWEPIELMKTLSQTTAKITLLRKKRLCMLIKQQGKNTYRICMENTQIHSHVFLCIMMKILHCQNI